MKKIVNLSLLIAFVVLYSSSTFSQDGFVGKIDISLKDKTGTSSMLYYIKNDKIKMEIQSAKGEANIVFDQPNKKIIMMMPAMKMYMSFPWDKIESNAGTESTKKDLDFKKTGKTKKICGYDCEQYIMTDDEGTTEAWMTNKLGRFLLFDTPMSGKSQKDWQKELADNGSFPMLIIHKNSAGEEEQHFEVTQVKKVSLDDDFFAIPDGYKEMKMGGAR